MGSEDTFGLLAGLSPSATASIILADDLTLRSFAVTKKGMATKLQSVQALLRRQDWPLSIIVL